MEFIDIMKNKPIKLQLLHLKIITLNQRVLRALLHKSKYIYVSTKTLLTNTQLLTYFFIKIWIK